MWACTNLEYARRRVIAALFAAALLSATSSPVRANDYPTAPRVDYVIGCMAANGNTRQALIQCSCAVDVIAGIMFYSVASLLLQSVLCWEFPSLLYRWLIIGSKPTPHDMYPKSLE